MLSEKSLRNLSHINYLPAFQLDNIPVNQQLAGQGFMPSPSTRLNPVEGKERISSVEVGLLSCQLAGQHQGGDPITTWVPGNYILAKNSLHVSPDYFRVIFNIIYKYNKESSSSVLSIE